MGSLDSPSILICEDDYIILTWPLRRLPFSSHSLIQSSGDHIDDSSSRLVIHRLFSRLGSLVIKESSRWVPSVLSEIASSDEVFYFILELDALLGGMTASLMEPTVPSSIEAFCLQTRRSSQIFCSFDLHQDLCTRSRERSVGVILAMHRLRTSPSGRSRAPSLG